MTLQEAIMDKNRPLSVTPQEWMSCEEAKDHEDEENIDNEAKRIVARENGIDEEDAGSILLSADERLEIGIEQMVLGCRMSMRALQEIDRHDRSSGEREVYNKIKDFVYNAVAPYLGDILKVRKDLFR